MLPTTDVLASRTGADLPAPTPQEPVVTAHGDDGRDLRFRPGLRVKLSLAAGGERRALVTWSRSGAADFTITS